MINSKSSLNILIIEDNPGDFTLVQNYLSEYILPSIVHAENFKEASAILSDSAASFDAILLDLSLPDKSGNELITGVLNIARDCPIIVFSGYSDVDFSIQSISLGISDYLLKDDLTSTNLYKSISYCVERKKKIQELRESEKQYNDLFQLSPQPMWVYDFYTLQFMDVNEAAISHYGYSLQDFVNMSMNDIIATDHDENIIDKNTTLSIKDDLKYSQKIFRHRKKDGGIIQVEVESNIINYKGKKACLTLANDITDRLKHIEAITRQNKKLQEIAWIQSHIVRAPLAKIMGLIDLMQNHKLSDTEKGDVFIHILNGANELDVIVKEIVEKTETMQLNAA